MAIVSLFILIMSVNDDLGLDDVNADRESISNQSGDTLLLYDDEENINTYADVLRRERNNPIQIAPGSLAEDYLGRGRLITDFERRNFGFDNITPGRPLTAYFSAGYFIDSKAVFDKLAELGIPRESIVCLQRRPSRDMLITFKDEETKNKFVSRVTVRFRDSSSIIDDEDMPLTFLNVYDAPHELPDEALVHRLSEYCSVFSTRRGKFPKSHAFNGMRHYRVRIIKPLPSFLRFGKFLVRLSHDGQQHTCRRCNRAGHFANECQNLFCFNCEELGHEARDCEDLVHCCICKSTEHVARRCRFSWYKASSARVSRPVPNNEPNDDRNDSNNNNNSDGGNIDRNMDSNTDHNTDNNVNGSADDNINTQASDQISSDHVDEASDSDLLAAAAEVSPASLAQQSDETSGSPILDSQGFLAKQMTILSQLARRMASVPNPLGPQSTADIDSMNSDLSADHPADSPTVPPADLPADPPADPPDEPADPPADPPAVSPADSPAASPADPPVVSPADPPADSPADPPSVRKPGPSRLPTATSTRRKPAPMPPALEALARRPTRPTLPVTGKSSASAPPRPPVVEVDSDVEVIEEMVTQTSLKRKPESAVRKKVDPKKGKKH